MDSAGSFGCQRFAVLESKPLCSSNWCWDLIRKIFEVEKAEGVWLMGVELSTDFVKSVTYLQYIVIVSFRMYCPHSFPYFSFKGTVTQNACQRDKEKLEKCENEGPVLVERTLPEAQSCI